MSQKKTSGPLAGVRVVEFAGLGPGPFACMLLSDMGADVVTVDRPTGGAGRNPGIAGRGRTWIQADLKNPTDRERVLTLLEKADVLVEGFRPGVMERLGLGPEEVARCNPALVYSRMTGWGQSGPLAPRAGHDINYIAITGALHAIGPAGGPPVPPLNLVGDYGGGSLFLVVGILAALYEARSSGKGQVVDAAICDGVTTLMTHFMTQQARGKYVEARGSNMLDGGAPYYGVYETADGKHVCIGPIEQQFFRLLCDELGIDENLREAQNDRSQWPQLRAELERAFLTGTREEWETRFESLDACLSPVMSLSEAAAHPHNVARGTFMDIDGVVQPAPAPRFSRTESQVQSGRSKSFVDMETVLIDWT